MVRLLDTLRLPADDTGGQGVTAVRFGRSVRRSRGGLVMARRKAPEALSGGSELPPAGLFDGHVVTRMVAFIEPGDPPGGHAAFRRMKSAQHVWLLGHGYEGRQGHADWGRFNRDHNRPVFYGGRVRALDDAELYR